MDQALQSYLARVAPTVPAKSAQAVIELAAEGATVPFIARYRKEKTGNLDEVQIRAVIEGHRNFQRNREAQSVFDQGNRRAKQSHRRSSKTHRALMGFGRAGRDLQAVQEKEKTKATIAREAGLEPLAQWIWDMGHGLIKDDQTMEMVAKKYLNPTAKIQNIRRCA